MMTFDHRLPAHKPFARCAFLTFVFEDTKKSLVCFDRTRGDANLADVIIARQRPLCLQATARAVWTKVPARSEAFAVVERIHCVQDVLLPSTRLMLEVASCWQVVAGLRQETNRFVQCNSHSYFTSFGTTVTAILPRLVPQSQLFCLVRHNSHSYFTSFGATVTAVLPRSAQQSQLFYLVRCHSQSYFASFGATVTPILPRLVPQSQLFCLVRHNSHSYFTSFGATVRAILPRSAQQSQLFYRLRLNNSLSTNEAVGSKIWVKAQCEWLGFQVHLWRHETDVVSSRDMVESYWYQESFLMNLKLATVNTFTR